MDELILDLPAASPPAPPGSRLSYSSLSTYETCGLQYKLRYLDRLPVRPSPILSFGNSLHEALRRWYNQPVPVPPPVEELLAHLDDVWDESQFPSAAASRTYKDHGRQVLTAFHEANAPSFRIPVALEQRFEIDVEGVKVSGVIDRMDRHPDGTYEIIDYKTNRRLPPLSRVEKDLQLSIYYLAAWEVWGIRPDKLTLYFLLPGQPLSGVRTPEDAAATRERILRVAEQIRGGDFAPRDNPLCNWCDFQARCPLYSHMLAPPPEDGETGIQPLVDEWIGRKKRMLADWRRLEEIAPLIHEYCERNGLQRVFGKGGSITRFERAGDTFDPALVRDALPPEMLEQVIRVDDAAVGELLAGDLPDEIRARIEEARASEATWSLRLREDRKR
ncbi:MAG TPA: PD-(D/E)XK nuclease family protein [Actinomycetota bacterium]|nr:PD-(D/E)XK nuclease family protein [Actinomycetota bacterium]